MRWARLISTGRTWGTVGSALLLVALAVPACGASGPTTHVNQEFGFAIDLDPRFREVDTGRPVPGSGPGALERPDFAVVFADPAGPRIHGVAANVVDVKVIDLGLSVTAGDPRLANLPQLLAATLASRGDSGVRRAPAVHVQGAVSCAAEYTDPRGRHGLTCIAVAGRYLYALDAKVTHETRPEVWPLLTDAAASFRVRPGAARPSGPRTYVDSGGQFTISCDRRFMRMTIDRGCWAADALLVLADPLSGVAANGRFHDGLIVYAAALPARTTDTQRRRIAAEVRKGLDQCGMEPMCPERHTRIGGLPACLLESRCPDGSRDLLCVVFASGHGYFIEGCAQGSTWATVKPLYEAAMRSFRVRARRIEA
ncbi:MAG: hypothetical protein V2J16_10910 [Thermoleophilia bacterium]|jgi:hypothetical protein|nr:hypothetical protein [Thermoleophilia bacterium]